MMQTLKEILIEIIGNYTPDLTAEGIAQIDFVWIAGAILLIAMVISFFKAIRFVLGGFNK